MGRKPCCDKLDGLKKGPWTGEEDQKLTSFILNNGIHCWRLVPKLAGVMRCGKSCRLRWMNYLRPGLKREPISEQEEALIIQLHSTLGNRWSKIAEKIPGRTDNEIKNRWNKMKKKLGFDDLHSDQDQTHKQPADDKEMDDHVEHSKSSEAKQVVESINSTGPSRAAGSKVDDDISKTNGENINGGDHRSSSSSSCGSSSTTYHENNANNNIPQVDDHQDHSFSLEMEESFSDKDFHDWLESTVVSCDGIDP